MRSRVSGPRKSLVVVYPPSDRVLYGFGVSLYRKFVKMQMGILFVFLQSSVS